MHLHPFVVWKNQKSKKNQKSWSEKEVCSGALLARCYFQAAGIDCAIDQLKPGIKSMAQYFLFFFFLLFKDRVSNMHL